jgi:transcriptional repressor NrdR
MCFYALKRNLKGLFCTKGGPSSEKKGLVETNIRVESVLLPQGNEMRVMRKDGREEEFVPEKIVVAVVKAGGKVELARVIAREVSSALAGNEIVTTQQIRNEVLKRLQELDTTTYNSWISYDSEKK